MRNQRGITLVELLVAMAIFGIFLAALGGFFASNNRISNQQISAADANLALRQSLLRMTEVITQAAYIYPAGQSITLTSSGQSVTVTTGADVLAVLVPAGNVYCTITTRDYCGFLYRIQDRTPFVDVLGSSAKTQFALIEWQSRSLSWTKNTLPTSTLTTWSNATRAVMADSIVPFTPTNTNGSSLSAAANLSISQEAPILDDQANLFDLNATARNEADGLVSGVAPRLVIAAKNGSAESVRAANIFSRAIPRAMQPVPRTATVPAATTTGSPATSTSSNQ
jgi:prepilin-type N-terminal cleavage/methylation domain-containing protein